MSCSRRLCCAACSCLAGACSAMTLSCAGSPGRSGCSADSVPSRLAGCWTIVLRAPRVAAAASASLSPKPCIAAASSCCTCAPWVCSDPSAAAHAPCTHMQLPRQSWCECCMHYPALQPGSKHMQAACLPGQAPGALRSLQPAFAVPVRQPCVQHCCCCAPWPRRLPAIDLWSPVSPCSSGLPVPWCLRLLHANHLYSACCRLSTSRAADVCRQSPSERTTQCMAQAA